MAAALTMLAGGCGGGEIASEPVSTSTGVLDPALAARVYLDSAITLMEKHSFRRRVVFWPVVRSTARTMATGATSPAGTYPAIRNALAAIGDGHSFLQPPVAGGSAERVPIGSVGTASVAPPSDSLDGEIVGGRFGYLRVPTFSVPGGAPDAVARSTQMADTLQALLRLVDTSDPCGWIIDLRHNLGGNMWPMLVGVGPVLGAGPYGAFVSIDDYRAWWTYSNGAAGILDASGVLLINAQTGRAPYVLRRPNPPVAVLTDSLTASSGEAITVSFRGRPATRSFGGATYGVPTGNSGFRLSDGAFLFIMTSIEADRTGQQYDNRIPPDVVIAQTGRPATDDATVLAATSWLATQAACTSAR